MPRLIGADDICDAVERTLLDHLALTAAAAGFPDQPAVKSWHQTPTPTALSTAQLPAGTISCGPLEGRPTRSRARGTSAAWRVQVATFERGTDWSDTASRARRWAKLIRATIEAHPSLDGVASSVRWIGDDFRVVPDRNSARTLGGCEVTFVIGADNVTDLTGLRTVPGEGPAVQSAHSTVSVRPLQE